MFKLLALYYKVHTFESFVHKRVENGPSNEIPTLILEKVDMCLVVTM